jgi:hypothetical protein
VRGWQKRKAGDNRSNKKQHNRSFILNERIMFLPFRASPSLFSLVAGPEEAKNATGRRVSA